MIFKEQIHDYIHQHKDEIVNILKELIRIPSVRSEAEENAPFGAECARVLEFTKNLYEDNGFDTELDREGGYLLSYYGEGKWVPKAPSNYFDLKEYNSSENYNLISCESHLSQAKKVLEFCFLDRVAEAKEWSEKVAELTRMPV